LDTIRIEAQRRFPVSLREGFEYITNPANWPAYWPRLVRMAPGMRWREPGDRASVTLRLLGRDVELQMTLAQMTPYQVVEYTSEQRGLPTVRHVRRFAEADGGLAYQIVVEYQPRHGWRRLFDRFLVRRAIRRSVQETIANLERCFQQRR
jgi:hypothetical protein